MNRSKIGTICLLLSVLISFLWTVNAFGSPSAALSASAKYRYISTFFLSITAILALFTLPLRPPKKRLPLPYWYLSLFGLLILWGGFMALNAHSSHSMEKWSFTPNNNRLTDSLPGSMASNSTLYATLELIMLLLVSLAVARSVFSDQWVRLLKIFGITAALVTLTAISHKILGFDSVWGIADKHPKTFFAPFIYNANAAAFLNLLLPVSISLMLLHSNKRNGNSGFAFWLMISIVVTAGVIATASKGGLLICIATLFLLGFIHYKRFISLLSNLFLFNKNKFESILAAILTFIIALSLCFYGWEHMSQRWHDLFDNIAKTGESGSLKGRTEMMKKMIEMSNLSNGSWHGFGPNTFPHVFPYYNPDSNPALKGLWLHGHCDPLQTVVEWGYLGTIIWLSIGIPPLFLGYKIVKSSQVAEKDRLMIIGLMIGLIGVGLHSCFDFPLSILSIHLVAIIYCSIITSYWYQNSLNSPSEQNSQNDIQ